MPAAPFDAIAPVYDQQWTFTAVGQSQRAAVWRVIDSLFRAGDHVLDLGCGTGVDALHLKGLGIRVTGVDASAAMVHAAKARGIDARQLDIENLNVLAGRYDGALSNFGALNCVPDLRRIGRELARLIPPGGRVAICLMGRICLRESVYYLLRGQPRKAVRRWRGCATTSLGGKVYYPSVGRVVRALRPAFSLTGWSGVGVCVPPSYVPMPSEQRVEQLSLIDARVGHWPLLRAAADHRLLVFVRE